MNSRAKVSKFIERIGGNPRNIQVLGDSGRKPGVWVVTVESPVKAPYPPHWRMPLIEPSDLRLSAEQGSFRSGYVVDGRRHRFHNMSRSNLVFGFKEQASIGYPRDPWSYENCRLHIPIPSKKLPANIRKTSWSGIPRRRLNASELRVLVGGRLAHIQRHSEAFSSTHDFVHHGVNSHGNAAGGFRTHVRPV